MKESDGIKADKLVNDADPTAASIENARTRILNQLSPCSASETIDCASAQGRIVAKELHSEYDIPSFRASAMDGYAVRSSDCHSTLQLAGSSLAGHPGADRLIAGSTQRITTGARVPDDADAVVQQENVSVHGEYITINKQPEPGEHVRNPGTDMKKGSVILQAGDRIGSAQRALLAANGITRLDVVRRLRIALFSTGDELCEPGAKLQTGQINDANRALLISMLNQPMVDVFDLGIARDTEASLKDIFIAAADADVIISSGGVSVGDADYVKSVVGDYGSVQLWKVAMKPGRPLTFAKMNNGAAFFGLPGNPVSAALTCLLFVKPAICHMLGTPDIRPPALQLPLQGCLRKNPGRVEYQRARMVNEDSIWSVTTTGVQDSHVLSSLHKANCLIELSNESTGANEGDDVTVIPFTHFGTSPL